MSYCGPSWISKNHHNQQLNLGRLNATTVSGRAAAAYADGAGMGTQPPTEPQGPAPYVSLTGVVDEDGEVSVTTVARVRTRADVLGGIETPLRAELIEDGEVVASGTVFSLRQQANEHHPCGCGDEPDEPPYAFQALVADRTDGDELRIREGDEVLWRQQAPDEKPTIETFDLAVEDDVLVVDWEARTGLDRKPEAWLRWSDDEGERWHALTVGVKDEHAEVDIRHLAGDAVWIQLLVHDGFTTVEAVSEPIQLPARGPSVTIMHPQESETVTPGGPLRLWGLADVGGTEVSEKAYRWTLDGEHVGEGSDLWIQAPPVGSHEVALTVVADDREASESVTFEVKEVTDRQD